MVAPDRLIVLGAPDRVTTWKRRRGPLVGHPYAGDPSHPGYPVLQPGATYYYNVRNFNPSSGTISCPSSPGRCDAFVESLLPR